MEQNNMIKSETEKRPREFDHEDLSYKKMRLNSDANSHEKGSKRFEKQQERYIKEGLTQQAQLFLRRMTSSKKVPIEYKHLPLLRMLVETCKELILKEFEIAVWSIYLEKVVWSDKSISLPLSLYISAYVVKKNLNKDVSDLKSYLINKIPEFGNHASNWISEHIDQIEIKPYELNQKFKELSQPPAHDLIDYNFYVDDILQIAPPSSSSDKPVTHDTMPAPDPEEEIPMLSLINCDSIFNAGKSGVEFDIALVRNISITQNSDNISYPECETPIYVNDSMTENNSYAKPDRSAESPALRRFVRSEDFSTDSLV
jgi:DNA-binding winged helix-turn-helix (wHTH) protein